MRLEERCNSEHMNGVNIFTSVLFAFYILPLHIFFFLLKQ